MNTNFEIFDRENKLKFENKDKTFWRIIIFIFLIVSLVLFYYDKPSGAILVSVYNVMLAVILNGTKDKKVRKPRKPRKTNYYKPKV